MKLGEVLRKWRLMSELNLRDTAKLMGMSAATLSRFERGFAPDGNTLAKILVWLMERR